MLVCIPRLAGHDDEVRQFRLVAGFRVWLAAARSSRRTSLSTRDNTCAISSTALVTVTGMPLSSSTCLGCGSSDSATCSRPSGEGGKPLSSCVSSISERPCLDVNALTDPLRTPPPSPTFRGAGPIGFVYEISALEHMTIVMLHASNSPAELAGVLSEDALVGALLVFAGGRRCPGGCVYSE